MAAKFCGGNRHGKPPRLSQVGDADPRLHNIITGNVRTESVLRVRHFKTPAFVTPASSRMGADAMFSTRRVLSKIDTRAAHDRFDRSPASRE